MTDLRARSDTVSRILARALAGETLAAADGHALMRARAGDFGRLLACAGELRDRGLLADGDAAAGARLPVTYSRKVFIPLTNLCRDACAYCTFARSPEDPAARTLTPGEVLEVARAGREAGCREALFSLGEHPEQRHPEMRRTLARLGFASTVEYLAAMCDLVHRETGLLPHANCGVATRDELRLLRECNVSMGLMLENSSPRLLGRGQVHHGCPGKVPAARLETMRTAGELGIAFTTGILIGIGETPEERVDSLLAIRDLQREQGHIQEVIIQNFRAKPDTPMGGRGEPTALDMARTIAVARLLLGAPASLQAPPNLAPDAYGFYLLAGINDWGGVSPVTRDHINPEAAWPAIDALAEVTREAGFVLRERLALYPAYLQDPRFVRGRFSRQIRDWTGPDGLVREELVIC